MLAVAAAMLAAGSPAMAASCNGNGHEIVLSNGRATPGTGMTSTAVRFSVHYADSAGCAPSQVVVVVPGVGTFALSGSGSDYTTGATFSRAMSLPAGSHAYSFKATSGSGNGGEKTSALSSVSPSRVSIAAPTPRPTATPPPPPPTAQPAPPHRAARATSLDGNGGADRQAQPQSQRPSQQPRQRALTRPAEQVADRKGRSFEAGSATDGWWSAAIQGQTPLGVQPGPATLQPPDSVFEFVPGLPPSLDGLGSLGVLVSFGITTAGGLALFFILLRTRRCDTLAPPPPVTAAIPPARATAIASSVQTHAAAPVPADSLEGADTQRASPLPPMRELIPPIDYDLLRDPDERVGPEAHEADIPRWLRPSVRAGRFGEEPTRRRDWGD